MFTVYLDESFGKENAYTVAGYVATDEQWTEFEREWNELCKDVSVRYIHKKELEHQRGEFAYLRDLPSPEADAIMYTVNQRAPGIILRRVNAAFAASVYTNVWHEADKGRWGTTFGESFYAAGSFACLRLVSTWIQRFNRDGPIRYVFEKGADGKGEVEAMLKRIDKNDVAKAMARMGGWSFEDGKKVRVCGGVEYPPVLPLQAADFLAYEMYRHTGNRVVEGIKFNKNGDEIPTRYPFRKLLQQDKPEYAGLRHYKLPTPYFMLFLDKPKIAELVQYLDGVFPP